jgi:hypothetical protein
MTKAKTETGASRRQVLEAGVAGALASALPLTASAAAAGTARFHKAVYDARFPEGAAFGAEMQRRGVPVQAIKADITPFYNSLHRQWKEGPTLIAGLTSADSLFALELMAQGAGMRVAFRAEQRLGRLGKPEWLLQGPQGVIDLAALTPVERDWGLFAAKLAAACPARWTAPASTTAACAGAAPAALDEQLTAWVIAPVIRA